MICTFPGCEAESIAKGLCPKHYMRARRHGDAAVTQKRGPKPRPSPELIEARQEIERLRKRVAVLEEKLKAKQVASTSARRRGSA